MDKRVLRSEKDKIELFHVLKKADKLSIRGKQSVALIAFYDLVKKYHSL
jgi:hypothetical protein